MTDVPDIHNDMQKAAMREVLNGVAQKCKDQGTPLLCVLVRNPDGSLDLDDVRRWWKIRYDEDLPSGSLFADQAVTQTAEAETQRVYEWQRQGGQP